MVLRAGQRPEVWAGRKGPFTWRRVRDQRSDPGSEAQRSKGQILVLRVGVWELSYPGVILQHKRRDVDLLGPDAGEELLQAVQVVDLLLHPRHAEGGEEPGGDLQPGGAGG